MLWNDQVREWKDEAREEGLAEGRAEGREEGRAAGIAEGEKRGKKENAVETARKLLKCNVSAGIISECTGLSLEELDGLKAQM